MEMELWAAEILDFEQDEALAAEEAAALAAEAEAEAEALAEMQDSSSSIDLDGALELLFKV